VIRKILCSNVAKLGANVDRNRNARNRKKYCEVSVFKTRYEPNDYIVHLKLGDLKMHWYYFSGTNIQDGRVSEN